MVGMVGCNWRASSNGSTLSGLSAVFACHSTGNVIGQSLEAAVTFAHAATFCYSQGFWVGYIPRQLTSEKDSTTISSSCQATTTHTTISFEAQS